MKCRSKKKSLLSLNGKGFTLAEAAAAILILAFICSGVLVVINRSMGSAADVTIQMQAFEIARENMEQLLSTNSIKEYTDFGYSEKHPQIQWQTTVESFYEPITDRLWIQALCSAEYTDSKGQQKKIELTHWLTDLSKKQILELFKERKKQQSYLGLIDQLIDTLEQAAEYAGVDEDTIEQWAENGMPVTEDGYFIKAYLDLYKSTNGKPSAEETEQAETTLEGMLDGTIAPGDTSAPDNGDDETEPEPDEQPKPEINCYELPLCQQIPCLVDNGKEHLITWDEVMKWWRKCLD